MIKKLINKIFGKKCRDQKPADKQQKPGKTDKSRRKGNKRDESVPPENIYPLW